jgi:hypothetical protein
MGRRTCRLCGEGLDHTFVDLGAQPLCESYVSEDRFHEAEPFYPLQVFVCGRCFLVQLDEFVSPEAIFGEYAYFSSYSSSWVEHMKRFAEAAATRFGLGPKSLVVELASNDGYLLQHFRATGIPVLGVEPARNVARVAVERGIPTVADFFGVELARRLAAEGRRADLLVGNNVLAQVPDLHDFVGGMKILLAEGGTASLEFPHLLRLVEGNQFDTIYHEHFSYFSFHAAARVLLDHGLAVFDVDELPTHGGSLRVYARHEGEHSRAPTERVRALEGRERAEGLLGLEYYDRFAERVRETKRKLLEFLIRARRDGKRIAGYGAPGKGNTLLNYCGVRTDFLDYTVDRNPYKQGKYLPGTRIPIHPPERIFETKPDYVLVLPWNLRDEIVSQLSGIRAWGGRLVVPIPETEVVS